MSDNLTRHYANRDDLIAIRKAVVAGWKAEDARIADDRAERLAQIDRGLMDIAAVIQRDGGIASEAEQEKAPPSAENAEQSGLGKSDDTASGRAGADDGGVSSVGEAPPEEV